MGTLRRWGNEGRLRPVHALVGSGDRCEQTDWLWGGENGEGERIVAVSTRVSMTKQGEVGNVERQRLRLLTYAEVNGDRLVVLAGEVAAVGIAGGVDAA